MPTRSTSVFGASTPSGRVRLPITRRPSSLVGLSTSKTIASVVRFDRRPVERIVRRHIPFRQPNDTR
jgi:hypothetical protein